MKKLIGTIVLTAAIASVSIPAQASNVYGTGAASCGKWTSDKANDESMYSHRISWMLGFVSGAGFGISKDLEADSSGMTGWIDNYCAANPLKQIAEAAGALVYELEK